MHRSATAKRVFIVVDDVTNDGANEDEQPAVRVYENNHCEEVSARQWFAPLREESRRKDHPYTTLHRAHVANSAPGRIDRLKSMG